MDASPAPLAQRLRGRMDLLPTSCEVVDLTEPEPEPEVKTETETATDQVQDPELEPDSEPEQEPEPKKVESSPSVNWSKLTQVELRMLLRCFKLRTDGNKAALIRRLSLHTGSVVIADEEQLSEGSLQADNKASSAAQKKRTEREAREATEAQTTAARARRPQIVSWDIETTIPRFRGEGSQLLEFGGVVVDGNSLVEDPRLSFSTLVRPTDLAAITKRSVACNHITPAMVARAPSFRSVAPQIFDLLDGRTWLGHNILRFDIPQLTKHFEAAGLRAPRPAGVIDTLLLLKRHFGKRAGDLKMASLGRFFGQGEEQHRAMADARMTLNVIKHAGAIIFLERSAMEVSDEIGFDLDDIIEQQPATVDEQLECSDSAEGEIAPDAANGYSCTQTESQERKQALKQTTLSTTTEVGSGGLTDAQREQVARNRARAMELRTKKLSERLRHLLQLQQQHTSRPQRAD